jgi:hypothetical protein
MKILYVNFCQHARATEVAAMVVGKLLPDVIVTVEEGLLWRRRISTFERFSDCGQCYWVCRENGQEVFDEQRIMLFNIVSEKI